MRLSLVGGYLNLLQRVRILDAKLNEKLWLNGDSQASIFIFGLEDMLLQCAPILNRPGFYGGSKP
jgi:hypothetical protein